MGSARTAIPAMAAKLSWNETLQSALGSNATIAAAASPSDGRMARGRPNAMAATYTLAIIAARVTDGDMPATAAYSQSSSNGANRYRFLRRPSSHWLTVRLSPSRMPTCSPDMANRWEAPVALKSSTSLGGRWSRIPSRTAWPNAACGSGTTRSVDSASLSLSPVSALESGDPPLPSSICPSGNDITEPIPRRARNAA